MQGFRRLLAQRYLAMLMCASTLLLKLLVPTGYMVDSEHGRIAISICSGTTSHTMTMAMPGMQGDEAGHGKSKDHGKAEIPCAFSALSSAVLNAIDPIQLASLIAFVLSAGLVGALLPALADPGFLRPPLRGPPAFL